MLTSARVEQILTDCLYRDGEFDGPVDDEHIPPDAVRAEGVLNRYAFHPVRLASHRAEINELLEQLPLSFESGDSFLNACVDRNEELWGQHIDIERLLSLGEAIGRVEWLRHPMLLKIGAGLPYVKILPEKESTT